MLLLDVLAEPLQTGEGSVALVVVVDGRVESQGAKGADTAYTEENLLLDTVVPVTSVELLG